MKNHCTLELLPFLALASLFIKISSSASHHPVLTGPSMAYIGSRVAFRCILSGSPPPITYQLFKDNSFLVDTNIDLQGGRSASFLRKTSVTSDGLYHCKATAGGSTGVSNSIRLSVVTPASQTSVTSDPFPPVVYEGSRLILSCDARKGSHLSYTWFFNRKEVTSSYSNLFHLNGNQLVVERVIPQHAGNYSCIAWSMVQTIKRFSSSSEVQVIVKVYVSKPKIHFSVFKEGGRYHGNLTCWSSKGSPPGNISLIVDDQEMGSVTATKSLSARFKVDLIPGFNRSEARCQVRTEVQKLLSEAVNLEVVPVGGPLKVDVQYLYSAEFKLAATVLSCRISRGTFPLISWIQNNSVLLAETQEESHLQSTLPDYILTDNKQNLVLTKLGPEKSGFYQCRARNSYDDVGTWVESTAELVQFTEVCLTTTEIIAISFCCFLLLVLLVSTVCVFKMLDNMRARSTVSKLNSDDCSLHEVTSWSEGKMNDTTFSDCDAPNQVYNKYY
ncbi:Fc receptor-like protein 5 [Gouania willdenowi]|uniref:Fc receptor-like protein 5 n=1 Tax=Gouania willdenowi TaxID=441366 RepID=UPI0010542321|nr:Fc receptor-like protein 5 [Gouania willdenowi]